MNCEGCGLRDSVLVLSKTDDKFYCGSCDLKHNPPTMSLQQFKDGSLYNIEDGNYETFMALADFEECGWFVRRKHIVSREDCAYEEIQYSLEYYGTRKCKRCKYREFGNGYTECDNGLCNLTRVPRRGEQSDHSRTFC